MAGSQRKTRLVSFRVSEREYQYLRDRCATEGARTLSDFAREALGQVIESNGGNSVGDSSSARKIGPDLNESVDRVFLLDVREARL